MCFTVLFFIGYDIIKNITTTEIKYADNSINSAENKMESELNIFVKQSENGIPFIAKYSFEEGYQTQKVILTGTKVKNFENGIIYEFSLNAAEDF